MLQSFNQACIWDVKFAQNVYVFKIHRILTFDACILVTSIEYNSDFIVFICDNLCFDKTESGAQNLLDIWLLFGTVVRVSLVH